MGRQDYKYIETPLIGGINQAAEVADMSECADARNVWAPRGKLEQRPGYLGRCVLPDESLISEVAVAQVDITKEESVGVFTNTNDLSGLSATARWHLIVDAASVANTFQILGCGVSFAATNINANGVSIFVEYWDGEEWTYLDSREVTSYVSRIHLGATAGHCFFPWPRDLTTFDSAVIGGTITSAVAFRFTIVQGPVDAELDGSVLVDTSAQKIVLQYAYSGGRAASGLATAVKFKSSIRYLLNTQISGAVTFNLGQLNGIVSTSEVISGSIGPLLQPPTIAVVPETEEAFVASGGTVTRHLAVPSSNISATVETGDFAVGPNAPYDKNYIAQRSDFPAAKFITYFQNRIWYATDTTVGWGAALPYHKVFPLLSEESFADEDNSYITGLSSLGENLIVFKERSIWMMVFDSLNAFSEAVFRRRKIVSGVGCVAQASIQKINDELVFLSERGLYAFNGQSIRKITLSKGQDRLRDLFANGVIDRTRCTAVDWKKYGCYLLAFSHSALSGSPSAGLEGFDAYAVVDSNDLVLVWDYEHDTFWLWDDMRVQAWIPVTDANGTDHLYFVDPYSRIFELDASNYDHGAAITSYATTQRMGLNSNNTKSLRLVSITANNTAKSLLIECLPDDAVEAANNGTGTLSLTDFNEKEYGAAVYDTDIYTEERRRQNRLGFKLNGQYFQIRLTHSEKNRPWALSSLRVGFEALGIR